MTVKNIFDHRRRHIGTLRFLKNKNMFGLEFYEDNHYANTLVSVEGLDEYMRGFGFMTEDELGQLSLSDLL